MAGNKKNYQEEPEPVYTLLLDSVEFEGTAKQVINFLIDKYEQRG